MCDGGRHFPHRGNSCDMREFGVCLAHGFFGPPQLFVGALAFGDVRRDATCKGGLSMVIETQHSSLVDPSYGTIWLHDAIFNTLVIGVLTGYPSPKGFAYAVTVFRQNCLRP